MSLYIYRFALALGVAILLWPLGTFAQHKKTKAPPKAALQPPVEIAPLEILGIRPGITLDSIRTIMAAAGVPIREVREDTLSHSYAAPDVHVYVVDSIMCRLTYMRMAFLTDGTNRLRRLTMTPRESSIMVGATDDIENVLLLYFGQKWGKPELDLSPPLPMFRWRSGNIQMRGFIRRGYPMWVLEG
ncbi:MAG TPA: hypothetical protein VGM92_02525 [Candidatus Kapabacteria bacterium]|jgi:hypothetical protein